MADDIQFPAVCFYEGKMWVRTPTYPWSARAVRRLQGRTYLLCDSSGSVFRVGSPVPERRLTLADRLLNRWVQATYGVVEPAGHWTLDEFKVRVCEGLDSNKDFWGAVQPAEVWKMEVNAAKSYYEVMNLLYPQEGEGEPQA